MSNEIASTGTSALASLANISSSIAAAEQVLDVKDGGSFIKFSKGLWMANGEDEIEPDDVWALNPFSMIHGFVDFDDSNTAQEKVVPITQPRPDLASLPPAFPTSENGWQPVIGVEMKGVDGDFADETYMFKTNSYGGRKCMSDYLKQLQQKIATQDPNVVALVTLSSSSYRHTKWGMVHNPVFTFKSWSGIEESEVKDAAAEPAEEPKQRKRRGGKAKTKVEEPTSNEDDAPVKADSATQEEPQSSSADETTADTSGEDAAPRRRRRRRA